MLQKQILLLELESLLSPKEIQDGDPFARPKNKQPDTTEVQSQRLHPKEYEAVKAHKLEEYCRLQDQAKDLNPDTVHPEEAIYRKEEDH